MATGKEAGGVAVETVFYMNIQVLNSDLKLLKVNPYYQNINLPTHKGSKDEWLYGKINPTNPPGCRGSGLPDVSSSTKPLLLVNNWKCNWSQCIWMSWAQPTADSPVQALQKSSPLTIKLNFSLNRLALRMTDAWNLIKTWVDSFLVGFLKTWIILIPLSTRCSLWVRLHSQAHLLWPRYEFCWENLRLKLP